MQHDDVVGVVRNDGVLSYLLGICHHCDEVNEQRVVEFNDIPVRGEVVDRLVAQEIGLGLTPNAILRLGIARSM